MVPARLVAIEAPGPAGISIPTGWAVVLPARHVHAIGALWAWRIAVRLGALGWVVVPQGDHNLASDWTKADFDALAVITVAVELDWLP